MVIYLSNSCFIQLKKAGIAPVHLHFFFSSSASTRIQPNRSVQFAGEQLKETKPPGMLTEPGTKGRTCSSVGKGTSTWSRLQSLLSFHQLCRFCRAPKVLLEGSSELIQCHPWQGRDMGRDTFPCARMLQAPAKPALKHLCVRLALLSLQALTLRRASSTEAVVQHHTQSTFQR